MADEMNLNPFTSREPQGQSGRRSAQYAAYTRRTSAQRRAGKPRAGSMWAKIAICIALLAVALLAESLMLRGGKRNTASPKTEEKTVAASVDGAGETESGDEGETLGRLRFVGASGVKSVFAVSQRWDMPVAAYTAAKTIEDDTTLYIKAEAGEQIRASAAGEVRTVGSDEVYGAYVRVVSGSDVETIYAHIDGVCVEEGQPVLAGDLLGTVCADGQLYVSVSVGGAPVDPSAYLNLQADE